MDTSDPFIEFDSDGRCNLCSDFLENRIGLIQHARTEARSLASLFDEIKERGRNRRYDCVVGVSGGVDSSYTCLLAAQHGLRVLAVHLDNGWDSPTATTNIRKMTAAFGFAYASLVLPWSDFRRVQLAFLKASVPEADTPTDVAIMRAVHIHARQDRVPTILSGGNVASEGILPTSWHYNARDTRYSNAILDQAGVSRRTFATQKFGALDEIQSMAIHKIRTVYPLNFIDYDPREALTKLTREFGWKNYGPKHGESRYTRFVQTYYLYTKHGIDYRRARLSTDILLGKITRDAALSVLAEPPFGDEISAEVDYVAKKLDVDRAELERIIAAPPKFYVDYPNDSRKLGLLYDFYRRLTGRAKTSNF